MSPRPAVELVNDHPESDSREHHNCNDFHSILLLLAFPQCHQGWASNVSVGLQKGQGAMKRAFGAADCATVGRVSQLALLPPERLELLGERP